jgi:hypothetical protein
MDFPVLRPAVAVALLLTPVVVAAQGVRETPLGRPTATYSGEFSLLRSIRELSDGSVIVADPIEGTLQRIDHGLARATPLGRTGAGPGEYRQPDAVATRSPRWRVRSTRWRPGSRHRSDNGVRW